MIDWRIWEAMLPLLDKRPMLGPPGTGKGFISSEFVDFRLAATKRETCNVCVMWGGLHDDFMHMAYDMGGNPFTMLNERVFKPAPDPYPDCTFKMRLIA